MARRSRPRADTGRRPGRKRRPPRAVRPQDQPHVVPDTPQARLEEQTRREIVQVMKVLKADLGLSESERVMARIIEQHPEYLEDFQAAGDFRPVGDASSAILHVAMHREIEQRVVSRQLPEEMTRLARNKPWHEAVHEALELVAAELFGTDVAESIVDELIAAEG